MNSRKTSAITSALFFLLISSSSIAQTAKQIILTNPSGSERPDELIILSRQRLEPKLGKIPSGKYLTITKQNGQPLVVQLDDINQDGKWDEAVFLYSFAAKQKEVLNISVTSRPAAVKAVVLAHVRQRHKNEDNTFGPSVLTDTMPYNNIPTDFTKQKLPPYLTEGPGWENDKVGFRKYFDTRNTNDIWGKTTSRMVLEEVGVDPSVIYHHLDTWGMDILKVGKALGAGGLALEIKMKNGKDSLVRFGTNVKHTIYKQIADGPVRAVFSISYKGWKITKDMVPIDASEQISIWGGQYFFQNKVIVKNAPAGTKLVTGTIDFYTDKYFTSDTSSVKALYTFGQQSENKDNLGLAVLSADIAKGAFGHTPASGTDITNTYTAGMNIKPAKETVYRYYACWEKTDAAFATQEGFEKLLKDEINKMRSPILIQVK